MPRQKLCPNLRSSVLQHLRYTTCQAMVQLRDARETGPPRQAQFDGNWDVRQGDVLLT